MKLYSLCIAAAAALVTSSASAQPQQAVGFPIGEKSRLHANLDLGLTLDSNPDRFDAALEQSSYKASVRPGVGIDVPSESFNLGMAAKLSVDQYLGIGNSITGTDVGGDVSAKMRIGSQQSIVALRFEDVLTRTPTYFADLGAVGAEERRFRQWSNDGTIGLILRPGGGALEFESGYTNNISFYDDLPDSQRHGALLEARWRFLPKTAIVLHSDFSFFSANDANATLSSTPLNVTLGLRGQVTARLTTELSAGYGDTLTWQNGFFDNLSDRNTRTIIGRALLGYAVLNGGLIQAGYRRSLTPLILLDNYVGDTITARFVLPITARFNTGLYGEYEFRTYGRDDLKAQLASGEARAEYWILDYLVVGLNYRMLYQNADQTTGPNAVFLEDYIRHLFTMGVGLRY